MKNLSEKSATFIDLYATQRVMCRLVWKTYRSLHYTEKSFPKMIVTSRTWLKLLEHFYIESDRVTLCIGSYIEAAVYGRTEMTIELLGQKHKIEKMICEYIDLNDWFIGTVMTRLILAYLSGINNRQELALVICSTTEDLKDLLKKLKTTSINYWECHDKSDSSEICKMICYDRSPPFKISKPFLVVRIKKLIDERKPGDYKLLICTDDVLFDLKIRSAQHIVHFSLPSTWSMFTFRFSVLLDHHENLLARKVSFFITERGVDKKISK